MSDFILDRKEVMPRLVQDPEDYLIVTGLAGTARDVAALCGAEGTNYYTMAGAMGGAVPMGLGLALARPDKRVLVVTGDGELLMNVGALATVAVTGEQARGNLGCALDHDTAASPCPEQELDEPLAVAPVEGGKGPLVRKEPELAFPTCSVRARHPDTDGPAGEVGPCGFLVGPVPEDRRNKSGVENRLMGRFFKIHHKFSYRLHLRKHSMASYSARPSLSSMLAAERLIARARFQVLLELPFSTLGDWLRWVWCW